MDEENKEQKPEEIKETKQKEIKETKQEEQKVEEIKETKKEEAKTENKTTEPTQQETKKYETFKPIQEEPTKTKKKSKKGILISLLVLIVVVVGLCAYYYFEIYKNTKTIYQEALKDGIKSLTETTEEITKVKAKVKLGLNIELEDDIKEYMDGEEYIDEILDLINNTEMGLELQMDKEQQQVLYKFDSTYEKEDLIKMNMLIDAKKENAYIELEQFFDKVLKVEMTDTEAFTTLREAFETDKLTLAEEMTQSKALKIIEKELTKVIKEEYCSKEKEKIDIDSKEVSTDVYILEMTGEELAEELSTVLGNLKDNKEFTKCFIDEEEVKDELEAIQDELEDIDMENTKFTIKLYKKGMKQDLVRVDIGVSSGMTVAEVQITKTEEGYKFKLLQSGMTLMSGTVKEEVSDDTTKLDIKMEIKQVGKIELKIESSYITGEDIDKLDTKNAIDMDELTEKDLTEAYKRVEESKLYELVEKYVKLFTGSSLENALGSGIDSNNNISSNSSTSTAKTTSDNQIKTYGEEKVITFNIPAGYTAEFATDTLKNFNKGNTTVGISSYYSNKDTYLTSMVNSYVESYGQSEYYKNVEKSSEKTIEVNGKTFYYVEISYEYFDETYKQTFICTPVSDKEIYTVQVSSVEGIEQLNIEEFLNIQF